MALDTLQEGKSCYKQPQIVVCRLYFGNLRAMCKSKTPLLNYTYLQYFLNFKLVISSVSSGKEPPFPQIKKCLIVPRLLLEGVKAFLCCYQTTNLVKFSVPIGHQ